MQQQQMDPEEEREAIQTAVRRYIEADDEAVDETRIVIDKKEVVHTQRIERSWREVKQDLVNQHLDVLRRNIGVAMFRFNHLKVSVPFNERRKIVIRAVARHQTQVEELMRFRFSIYDDDDQIQTPAV